MARSSMGFLVAIAWIMAITEAAINVVADIWFRLWTFRCNNRSHDLCSGRLPRRSQQDKHKHSSLCPNHGLLHILRRAYGRFVPRHRYFQLLRDFANQRRAVHAIFLTRIY